MTTTNKREAAQALLARAIELYVDVGDYMAALVLAGAAEDVLEGLLRPDTSSRKEMTALITAVGSDGEGLSPNAAHNMQRLAYNWLRHADREDEPFQVEMDWFSEAGDVIDRAGVNHHRVTGQWPGRWADVVSLRHFGA